MPVGAYTGPNVSTANGVATVFPYDFEIIEDTDLVVEVDGVVKTLGVDYTVDGVGEPGGGNVTFTVAPGNGAQVLRYRNRPFVRETDYQRNGSFDEETVDKDFDSLQMQMQQFEAISKRALKAPKSVSADQVFSEADWAARAGKFVRIKNDGSGPEFIAASPDDDTFTASGAGGVARSWSSKVGDIVSVKDFGATGNGVTSDTAAIQAAITAMNVAGGGAVFAPPSANPYLLNAQGANPYFVGNKYCLEIKSNVSLRIPRGATLKLANAQQTDAGGPVDIITGGNVSNVYIGNGGAGRGRITGNTAGQAGWTGGYGQISKGCIINFCRTGSGGCSDVEIEGLQLDDHFANSVNVGNGSGIGALTGRNARIRYRDIYSFAVGEGPQVITADDVWMDTLITDDAADVMVGDHTELSDVTRFHLKGITCLNNGAGAGIDLFGARNGVCEDFVIDGVAAGGVDVNTDGTNNPENIRVGPGVISGLAAGGNGCLLNGSTVSGVSFQDVTVDGENVASVIGFQIPSANTAMAGRAQVINCIARRCTTGMLIKAIKNITVQGGQYCDNTADGIQVLVPGAGIADADMLNIELVGVTATGNGSEGIFVSSQGFTARPGGRITGCHLQGNTAGAIGTGGGAPSELRNFSVTDNSPAEYQPAQIAGSDQNDYGNIGTDGANLHAAEFWRIDVDAGTRRITGIAHGSLGRRVTLVNISAFSLELRNQNVGSAAGNRIITGTGLDIALAQDDTATLVYDNTAQRWRVIATNF